jgi:hypothetical protein
VRPPTTPVSREGLSKECRRDTIQEIADKALGDAELPADGKRDKAEGKAQDAVGGLKDTQKT